MVKLPEVAAISGHLEGLIERQDPEGPYDARLIDYLMLGVQALRRVLEGKSTWFELTDPLA